MTSIDWPASLPCFLLDGYGVQPRDPVLQTDFGLAIRRRQIYAEMLEELVVSMLLNPTQEGTFAEFYETTLKMGSLTFNAPILIEGSIQTREVKFIGDEIGHSPDAMSYVRAGTARLLTAV